VFEIVVQHHFCAAHSLRGYAGKCSNTHGHNFKVQLTIAGESLDDRGILVDFKDVKAALQTVIDEVDHQNLNDLPAFATVNPSTENLCRYFYDRLLPQLATIPGGAAVRLTEVRIAETDSYAGVYRPFPS
jgi:6-pyruvoyltetrahydropterin/6-carboxytetrahydropterin synthase